jgi:hypothetical protein
VEEPERAVSEMLFLFGLLARQPSDREEYRGDNGKGVYQIDAENPMERPVHFTRL